MDVFPLTPTGERFGRIVIFPPHPQGGTPEEELGNNDSNVLYFRSVPPWGLGGKRPFYNKLLKKKTKVNDTQMSYR